MSNSKKSSTGKIFLFSVLFLIVGLYTGYRSFSPSYEEMETPVKNPLFRGTSEDDAALRKGKNAYGTIHEVKDGQLIMDAVKKAKPGDLIRVFPGTYSETVYIDKDDITLQGVIQNSEWPTLNGKKELNDAFLYSGNGIQIENFKIVKYKGNGIMGQSGNNFVIRNNWIIDTGVYGIFPQFGKNGLIEYNTLTEIADAAIYVGMCDNIDVLHNEVFGNVAGIEIENSRHCLVENNIAYNNTGGILAFITPGLPIKTTYDVVIRNSFVRENNHKNFGAPGSIVSGIPPGTGILIMAADDVIIENNIIVGNKNAGITITDFENGGAKASKDPDSDPNPDNITILDNFMANNGYDPIPLVKALMVANLSTKDPDIIAVGKGSGSTIKNRNKYVAYGIKNYGKPKISDTKHIGSFLLDKPATPRKVSKNKLGEYTYYGVCSGCHAYDIRLIGVPVNIIQMIYQNNPQGIVEYINNPKNLREDYPDMPKQDYLSEEAKIAVAEYMLRLNKNKEKH